MDVTERPFERDQALRRAETAEAKHDEVSQKLQAAKIEIAELRGRLAERAEQNATTKRSKGRSKATVEATESETDRNIDQPDMFDEDSQTDDNTGPTPAE